MYNRNNVSIKNAIIFALTARVMQKTVQAAALLEQILLKNVNVLMVTLTLLDKLSVIVISFI
jgi:hypothetical protein